MKIYSQGFYPLAQVCLQVHFSIIKIIFYSPINFSTHLWKNHCNSGEIHCSRRSPVFLCAIRHIFSSEWNIGISITNSLLTSLPRNKVGNTQYLQAIPVKIM